MYISAGSSFIYTKRTDRGNGGSAGWEGPSYPWKNVLSCNILTNFLPLIYPIFSIKVSLKLLHLTLLLWNIIILVRISWQIQHSLFFTYFCYLTLTSSCIYYLIQFSACTLINIYRIVERLTILFLLWSSHVNFYILYHTSGSESRQWK